MSTSGESPGPRLPESVKSFEIDFLTSLRPEAQGDIDESILRDNLALTPLERIAAMSQAATQIEFLQRAMNATVHA